MENTRCGSTIGQRDMYHIFAPQGHRQDRALLGDYKAARPTAAPPAEPANPTWTPGFWPHAAAIATKAKSDASTRIFRLMDIVPSKSCTGCDTDFGAGVDSPFFSICVTSPLLSHPCGNLDVDPTALHLACHLGRAVAEDLPVVHLLLSRVGLLPAQRRADRRQPLGRLAADVLRRGAAFTAVRLPPAAFAGLVFAVFLAVAALLFAIRNFTSL